MQRKRRRGLSTVGKKRRGSMTQEVSNGKEKNKKLRGEEGKGD